MRGSHWHTERMGEETEAAFHPEGHKILCGRDACHWVLSTDSRKLGH
jgi:hypothetical protein